MGTQKRQEGLAVAAAQRRQPLGCRRCAADDERAAGPPDMKLVWSWIGYSPGSFANSLNGQFIDRKPLFYETTIRLFAAVHRQSRTPRDLDPNWRLQTWAKRRRRSFPRTRIHSLCYPMLERRPSHSATLSLGADLSALCASSARRPISRVPWAGCFHLRGGPVSRGPNRCLY